MSKRQLTTPLIIRGLKLPEFKGEVTVLHRVPHDDRMFDESWLQKLLFNFPSLLPISEIESIFDIPLPVCQELPVGNGAADLLFINASGYLTLVETKLWRNPEAKQAAVAQIVKYASDMAHWSYSDLVEATRRARKDSKGDPIVEVIKAGEGEEFDEKSFIDQVSQNLRSGRFLLLIVGDGIHEEVERMAEYLQQFPTLGFALGLVEMALYRTRPDSVDPIIVQPRVLARTQIVARTVIEIRGPVKPSEVLVSVEGGHKPPPGSITEDEYWKKLRTEGGEKVVEFVREVLAEAPDHGLRVEWMKAGPVLKYDDAVHDTFFNFGQLHWSGVLSEPGYLFVRFKELGLPLEICRDYLDEVARLVPNTSRRLVHKGMSFESEILLYGDRPDPEDYVPMEKLMHVKKQWLSAIDKAIGRIQEASGSK